MVGYGSLHISAVSQHTPTIRTLVNLQIAGVIIILYQISYGKQQQCNEMNELLATVAQDKDPVTMPK